MKTRLVFDSEVEGDDELLKLAQDGFTNSLIVDEIWEKCFRPNQKHGYNDPLLDSETANLIISKLADIYHEVLEEYRE